MIDKHVWHFTYSCTVKWMLDWLINWWFWSQVVEQNKNVGVRFIPDIERKEQIGDQVPKRGGLQE